MNAVSDWVISNRLVLIILKTKSIVFGPRHSLAKNPTLDLHILGQSIKQDDKVRLLGITISNTLSWSEHINQIVAKMGRSIAAVRKCANYLTPEIRRQVVQTLVLCHLDYCSVIWASAPKSELIKLQTAQNRAARLTLDCSYRSSVDRMNSCFSWLKVNHRLSTSLLLFIRNIIHSKHPTAFSTCITKTKN